MQYKIEIKTGDLLGKTSTAANIILFTNGTKSRTICQKKLGANQEKVDIKEEKINSKDYVDKIDLWRDEHAELFFWYIEYVVVTNLSNKFR